MSLNFTSLASLTIEDNSDVSRVVDTNAECGDAEFIGLIAPTFAVAATSIIEVCDTVDGTFVPLVDENGDPIIGPSTAEGMRIFPIPAPFWRLKLNATETPEAEITFYKLWNAY